MNYFDYLSLTRKEDTRETFISYLVDCLDYTEQEAIKESELFYESESEE